MTAETTTKPVLRPSDGENLAGQDTGRDILSHSRLGIFLACQRKYDLHYEQRLERLDRPEALAMGSAFQYAVQHRTPEAGEARLLKDADRTLDLDNLRIKARIVYCAAALYLDRWVPICEICQGNKIVHDPEFHEMQTCDTCEGTGYDMLTETREMEYLVRLRNPWTGHYSNTFDLKGYADGVRPLPDHTLELVENKLVGQITAMQVRKLVLDRQVSLSAYGLWRATGNKVSEVRYRYVRKPSIKPRQKETVDQFLGRLEEDYLERPDFYAHEETLYRTDEDMLRIEAELWMWAQQIRDMRRQAIYPRNTSSCDDYGGCQFLPICTAEPDHKSFYRIREKTA